MTTMIQVGLLSYFAATIEQYGGDSGKVISAAGLDPSMLEVADIFIPYSQYRELLVRAVEATGCERFGLFMAKRLGPRSLGVVGFGMQQSATIGAAFESLAKFIHLHDQHGYLTLEAQGDFFRIGYVIDDLDKPGAAQAIDVSAALGNNMMKTLAGRDIQAVRYEFPYPQPADVTPYEFFNTQELMFNADSCGIVIDNTVLNIPVVRQDPHMANMLGEYLEALSCVTESSVAAKVELIVRDILSSGQCTLVLVAELLKVTPRTLQNTLQSENSGFHEIVEHVRKTQALHYLQTSPLDLTHIAQLLGYSDSTAFSRSFRRWYNETPSQWRKSNVLIGAKAR